jgi:hypothetical protein
MRASLRAPPRPYETHIQTWSFCVAADSCELSALAELVDGESRFFPSFANIRNLPDDISPGFGDFGHRHTQI